MKFSTKLTLSFIAIGMLPFIVVGVVSLVKSGEELSVKGFHQLESIREIKKAQIERYFAERFGDVEVLSKNASVLAALQSFEEAFLTDGERVAGETWRGAEAKYGPWLSDYKRIYGYYDLFLIDDKGNVVYTVAKESDFGENLVHGSLRNSPLGESFKSSKQQISLQDFAPYAPSNGEPASFIGAPVHDAMGNRIGVVALQISLEAINAIMTERSGMGKTGETYLVGSDKLMRSDSFLDPTNHSVEASFSNPAVGSVDTDAAREALGGKTSSKIIIDYNGNPVLSSYTPIKVGNLNWALLAEIDESEAFAAVNELEWLTGIIGIIGVAAIVCVALWISGGIKKLLGGEPAEVVDIARKVAEGDLDFAMQTTGVAPTSLYAAVASMVMELQEKTKFAERIAQGDLTADVKLASEKDSLGKSLQTMVTNLNDLLGQIQVSGEQIASGAGQVSDSSQSLSQGATESASSLEEISSSMNEMASQTSRNAENANLANGLAATARDAAETGNARMQEMVKAMGEINDSGQNISKIIKTIDEIAFQTNLLALNAAVEAARAGQHGKGFAVVAEEVRNLAARSAKAASETAELIEGSVEKTEKGTQIAGQTAAALAEIVSGVGQVTDLVAEIAAASNEQAQGIAQVNQGLSQIDQVTQQNTANAEEGAAAAEELSGQSEQLRQMIGQFRIKGGATQYSQPAKRKSTAAVSLGWNAMKTASKSPANRPQIALDDTEFGKF